MSMRVCAGILGLCFILATGCEKSSSSPAGGSTSSGGAPNRVGGGDDGYGKKLVGAWEAKEKFGDKEETIALEFKADGSMSMVMGPFDMKGTYKVVKEEGKVVTIDTEMAMEGFGDAKGAPKKDKKTLTATFEDADTMVLQKVGEKPDPLKCKRKK